MTGVCGWLTPATPVENAQETLTRMRAGLGAKESDVSSIVGPFQAAAAWSPFGLASIYEDQDLVAIIDGRVSWDGSDLSRLAREVSPAAALLVCYRRHGVDCLRRIHGRFSIVVIESNTRTLLLAIDRMGVDRMCFSVRDGGVVFGSTVDSVIAHPFIERQLSHQGIYNYLFQHTVPAPGTIYEGVEKLLPAQYLLLRDGVTNSGFYWEADWHPRSHVSLDDYISEFKCLLTDSVGAAASKHHVGAFLSGGTDSSTVAGMLTKVSGRPAETFSIGFQADGFDEINYARIASRHFGTRQNEYYVTPEDVAKAVPLIAASYDEPFGNASAVPTYYCARNAKEAGVQVMLAGDGGDEIFGGNVRYAKQKIFEVYWRIPQRLRGGLIEPVLTHLPGADHIPPLRKVRSFVRQAKIPLPDRLESYNFLRADRADAIFSPDFLAEIDTDAPEQLMREHYFRTQSDSATNRMLHLDWKFTLADNDLLKVNRMCEVANIEVRYPLLDERMIAFAAALPTCYKVKGLKLRWFFKEALKDFLPPEIITKSKHGFGLPFGIWMQTHGTLREIAYDSLNAFRQRGYLNAGYLDQLIELHRHTHASYYGVMIWVIMILEQWLSRHVK